MNNLKFIVQHNLLYQNKNKIASYIYKLANLFSSISKLSYTSYMYIEKEKGIGIQETHFIINF